MNKLTILTIIGMMMITMGYISSCHSNLNIETAQYAVNGQKLYIQHCKNCHGGKGEGLGKLYPPLTDIKYLQDNRSKLGCIVKYGLQGEITINSEQYNQQMPANASLTDTDVAYILTYVTTHFGKLDTIYSTEEVKESLKNCK